MRTPLLLTLAAAIPICAASAQSPFNPPPQTPPPQATPVVNQPVLLDVVVVNDHDGHPLHNLKSSDFHLTDNNVPQTIQAFAEHSSQAPNPAPP
ncbi:MAG: hypothetical protein WB439_17565, partial [Acidobacteriaceae bacterium]